MSSSEEEDVDYDIDEASEDDPIISEDSSEDEEDNPEEFMEDVYKKELGNSFEKIEGGGSDLN